MPWGDDVTIVTTLNLDRLQTYREMKQRTCARVVRRVSVPFSLLSVAFFFLLFDFPVPLHAELSGYWPFDGDGRSEFGNAKQHGEIASTRDRSGKVGGAAQFVAEQEGCLSITLTVGGTASILELRREIIFSHPALNFDRLLINKRFAPNYLHQSRQYLGRYSSEGDGLAVLTDWKNSPTVELLLKNRLHGASRAGRLGRVPGTGLAGSEPDHRQHCVPISPLQRGARQWTVEEQGIAAIRPDARTGQHFRRSAGDAERSRHV